MARSNGVPVFHLYGEPNRSAADKFVHVESLHQRSQPANWTIHPHAHSELTHVFLITRGGGVMQVMEDKVAFSAPAILIVPAGLIHGFVWQRESQGSVITLAASYLDGLAKRDEYVDYLLRNSRVIDLSAEDVALVTADIERLAGELHLTARAYHSAVDSAMLSILVVALRRDERLTDLRSVTPGHYAALVSQLRARIEERYHLRESVFSYAKALGVSVTTLRVACARVAGTPPAAMLDQRALREAKRALLYSNRSVAQVGYDLGFSDPAYFSRFFRSCVGRSPRVYRTERGL